MNAGWIRIGMTLIASKSNAIALLESAKIGCFRDAVDASVDFRGDFESILLKIVRRID
jgi:hypothetical protein